MQHKWTCGCCGKQFETLPMSYAIGAPTNWFGLSEAERETRARLNADVCIIDGKEFYVRGCIELSVSGCPENFVWGVWVSVSEESFRYIHEHWDGPIDESAPPRFGWLCTWIQGYPEPREIKCHVVLRSGNLRPLILLEATDYPLAVEQQQGITLERVKEIAAGTHSPS